MLLFTAEDNKRLTHTGPGTPMGDLMRRYWFPAFLSERLPTPGGDPMAITLLNEELVAFRATDGRVGLMDRYCPHRRASLALARVEEDCAIRCIYHGWKISVDGQVLETPPEPPNSRFAQSITFPTYVTREAGGMVWAYMGPKELEPPFPDFPFNVVATEHVWANHSLQNSNWLQGLEGDYDAAHGGFLHFSQDVYADQRVTPDKSMKFLFDPRPQTDVQEMPWGLQTMFKYALEDPTEATFWTHPLVMPFIAMFGFQAAEGLSATSGLMHAWVPATDDSHYVYSVIWNSDRPLTPQEIRDVDRFQKYTAVDKANGYVHAEFDGETYPQDRESMRSNWSFSGFDGVHLQDLAVQHSMGPIVDRTKEHLGSEDFLVIQLRKYMLEVMRKHEAGGTPPGLQPGMDFSSIAYRAMVAPSDTPLLEVMNMPVFANQGVLPEPTTVEPGSVWSPLPIS